MDRRRLSHGTTFWSATTSAEHDTARGHAQHVCRTCALTALLLCVSAVVFVPWSPSVSFSLSLSLSASVCSVCSCQVGLGTAGCAFLRRLLDLSPCASVLVLEGGPNFSQDPTVCGIETRAATGKRRHWRTVRPARHLTHSLVALVSVSASSALSYLFLLCFRPVCLPFVLRCLFLRLPMSTL